MRGSRFVVAVIAAIGFFVACLPDDPGQKTNVGDAGSSGSSGTSGTSGTSGSSGTPIQTPAGQHVSNTRKVKCPNNTECTGTQGCCTSPSEAWASHNCTDKCGDFWLLDCDGRADCEAGFVCCASNDPKTNAINGSRCKEKCEAGELQLCLAVDECGGKPCAASARPPTWVNHCQF